jgi:hypothetical protein
MSVPVAVAVLTSLTTLLQTRALLLDPHGARHFRIDVVFEEGTHISRTSCIAGA